MSPAFHFCIWRVTVKLHSTQISLYCSQAFLILEDQLHSSALVISTTPTISTWMDAQSLGMLTLLQIPMVHTQVHTGKHIICCQMAIIFLCALDTSTTPTMSTWMASQSGNLAPSNTGVSTDTYSLTIKLADACYAFECLVHIYNPDHLYLNGFTVTGDVNLALNTSGQYTLASIFAARCMAMTFSSALVTSTTSIYMNGYTVPGNINLAPSFSGVATGTHMKIG